MKNLKNLGTPLTKGELKNINGSINKNPGGCYNEYYYCGGTPVWVGPCSWPHIAPC